MSTASTPGRPSPIEASAESQPGSSKVQRWASFVFTALTILFMLFDAFGKFAKPVQVVDAFTRLGIPISLSTSIGLLLVACTVLYAIPRTAVLGAVLMTGYLGGAVAIHMRAASTSFETVFPVIFGVLAWAGVYLRVCGLRRVFPVIR